VVTSDEVLALFGGDNQPTVLAHDLFYIPAPSRDGDDGARARLGGVFLHEPTAAALLPSDLPELSRRRPEMAGLRYVLVRFSFMLDRLPTRHAYQSATLTVTLDDPRAVVRLQRPAWVTPDTESTDTVTTAFSAAVDSLAKVGAQRTRVKGTTQRGSQLPVVTAEKRDRGNFGWRYEARDAVPLLPRVEYAVAGIELPRDVTQLTGQIIAHAEIEVPRWGVLTTLRAMPRQEPATFRLWLGDAG
jgi:hypothetical protein